ncbi:MAG TPA: retron St85 family RNA-directed DNA polymerase [Candidatus Acidoferrales bacterium]|nr:retron St85 family RNA-directed DNA polymerase [Candidatus Acidoferrales bacterium]
MGVIETRIASGLQVGEEYVRLVARTANHRYKVYQIPKKVGGLRTIHHPARELKLIQTWLVENLLSKLPVHPAASAYKSGSSVKKHANIHRHSNFLMKIDFQDFFPSITGKDVIRVLKKKFGSMNGLLAGTQDYEVVRRLVCRDDRLTIGAPSSPVLSNAVMYEFDLNWALKCRKRGVTYTRYADDLYFSTNRPNVLAPLLEEIRADLRGRKHPALQVNNDKTVFTSRKRRKLVTGVVITPEGRLSLGRKRKRYIKSLLFRHGRGELSAEQRNYLSGFLSFARSVEPSFIQSLKRKYGPRILAAAVEDRGIHGLHD